MPKRSQKPAVLENLLQREKVNEKIKGVETIAKIFFSKDKEKFLKHSIRIPLKEASVATGIPLTTLKHWYKEGLIGERSSKERKKVSTERKRGGLSFDELIEAMALIELGESGVSLREAHAILHNREEYIKMLVDSILSSAEEIYFEVRWKKSNRDRLVFRKKMEAMMLSFPFRSMHEGKDPEYIKEIKNKKFDIFRIFVNRDKMRMVFKWALDTFYDFFGYNYEIIISFGYKK